MVAVRDAVERQRPVAGGAKRPTSAGLFGVHDDDDVLTLAAAGDIDGWGNDNYGMISNIPAGNDFVKVSSWEQQLVK